MAARTPAPAARGAGAGDPQPSVERLDHFMARANAIYYATHDPFADFTTSPEISQVFGEILGLWAAVTWQIIHCPNPVLLVEAGPGRGTLMADARRAISRAAPAFAEAVETHLIETSPRLRVAQASRVPGAVWHDTLDSVPDKPMILLANEFLDALPIRQFVRRGTGWSERFVAAGRWIEQPCHASAPPPRRHAEEGQIIEVNEAAGRFVAAAARRAMRQNAVTLLVDYGSGESVAGNSLQAISGGRPIDPLSPPGTADLTAHVDFAELASTARTEGATVQGPVPQGSFLTALGLPQRTEALARGRSVPQAAALREAATRLTDAAAMGTLFKVLAIAPRGSPPLPGFPV